MRDLGDNSHGHTCILGFLAAYLDRAFFVLIVFFCGKIP